MASRNELVFISYAGPDRAWAEWAGWHLREAGHEVELDVWDWRTGDDFIERMTTALKTATAVVALFSPRYFESSRWTHEEWRTVVGRRGRFIPLVVEPLDGADVPALLSPLLRKDLYGLEEQAAVAALLEAVSGPSAPRARPAFPGGPAATPPAPSTGVPSRRPTLPGRGGLPSPELGQPDESLFQTSQQKSEARNLAKAPRRTDFSPRIDEEYQK